MKPKSQDKGSKLSLFDFFAVFLLALPDFKGANLGFACLVLSE